ncbi:MAG: Gfo/Idh/MocA family protein [Thermoguttaceae bacterium]
MASRSNRRQFMQTTAALGVGYWVAGGLQAKESNSPNERVAIAATGYGLVGPWNFADSNKFGKLVAVCEVDKNRLSSAGKNFPKAKQYTNYYKMLDEMDKSIDAVVIAVPDHSHTVMAVKAMKMGKHCFCQKPLTRTIWEARLMADVARQQKVCTQMGNQGTSYPTLRHAAALLRAKVVGKVSEVHVWTDRPNWPFKQGQKLPPAGPVPPTFDWDLWIGPAPMRPFIPGVYHPMSWRGFWDFGTGALGDMACHTVNMPYMGLDLKNPTSVVATCSGHNKDSFPAWSKITFEFPANDWREALTFHWYDGGKCPPAEAAEGKSILYFGEGDLPPKEIKEERHIEGKGCIVIGDKGKLYGHEDYCNSFDLIDVASVPKVEFTKCPDHFGEWINAVKGGPAARSNFPDYAGGLTETILLGNLAVWTADKGQGKKIEWDAQNLKPTNAPEVEGLVKPTYQHGYHV